MKFIHINPTDRTMIAVHGDKPEDVYPWKSQLGVDHGQLARARSDAPGLGIIVWEHGLLQGDGPYFSLSGQLFSGDAILYGFDQLGDTVDTPNVIGALMLRVFWLADKDEVEHAISAGIIKRPFAAINGKITWEWNR